MPEAVIIDCLRTPRGEGSARRAAPYAPRRSGGGGDPRAGGAISAGEGRHRRRDSGVRDAGGRGRQQHGARGAAARRIARYGAGDDHQSLLQFGIAGHRAGGGAHSRGLRARDDRRRQRIDEHDAARRAQAGAQSLVRGPSSRGLYDDGADGRAGGSQVRNFARRCRRVRAASHRKRGGAGGRPIRG
jgi:hypothetical protein